METLLLIGGLYLLVTTFTKSRGISMSNTQVDSINQNKLSGVKPILKDKVLKLIELAKAENVILVVTYGKRTYAEQKKLYDQGRTKSGNIITYKKPGTSKHEFGDAADIVFWVNGKPSYAESNDWKLIGRLAAKVGLKWGGNWKSFKDRPHVEL